MKRVRTANELENKYGLNKIYQNTLKNTKNIEYATKDVTELQQSLKDTRDAILINLGDIVQDAISLWFYSGVPTTSNAPYTSWQTPSDHIGDLYYDQSTGYVYKWNGSWQQQEDRNLIQAMALSNVGVDTSDHERQVFFTTPTNYECGDWWIQEDGTLLICQTTRATYNSDDWINSNEYSNAISTATLEDGVETQTTLRGTVITKTANWVKFEDLADGSSTTIYGGKISTNAITSNNYVQDTSGMKIDLTNGAINSKNFNVTSSGDLSIGGLLTSANGVLTNLTFPGESWGRTKENTYEGRTADFVGFQVGYDSNYNMYAYKTFMNFCITIPPNFKVTSAKLHLRHTPVIWYNQDNTALTQAGSCQNIKLYQAANLGQTANAMYGSEYEIGGNTPTFTPLTSTGLNFSNSVFEEKTSEDFKSIFTLSNNSQTYNVSVMTDNNVPSWTTSDMYSTLGRYTGVITGYAEILGYLKIS